MAVTVRIDAASVNRLAQQIKRRVGPRSFASGDLFKSWFRISLLVRGSLADQCVSTRLDALPTFRTVRSSFSLPHWLSPMHNQGENFDRNPDGSLAWQQFTSTSHKPLLHINKLGDSSAAYAQKSGKISACIPLRLLLGLN